jgi:hypothetical protein
MAFLCSCIISQLTNIDSWSKNGFFMGSSSDLWLYHSNTPSNGEKIDACLSKIQRRMELIIESSQNDHFHYSCNWAIKLELSNQNLWENTILGRNSSYWKLQMNELLHYTSLHSSVHSNFLMITYNLQSYKFELFQTAITIPRFLIEIYTKSCGNLILLQQTKVKSN